MSAPTRTVNVGIIGLGTVGGGVVRLVERHRKDYRAAFGADVRIVRACARHAERAAELGLAEGVFTTDWREVTSDERVDIVVEVIGGEHPAREIFEDAFARGKHVVSANKALLGLHMEALANAARAAGVQIRCEAAAAGGIPIVNALEHALVGNEVSTVAGIMNGTTNYILSRMADEGLEFSDVLADAQRLGYAEADPTADVDGHDAAAKLAILSSIAFHTRIATGDVHTEGIRAVGAADIDAARELGRVVKLLGVARNTAEGVSARVCPAMIPADHQLAAVKGAMNAVYVVGDAVGETMFYGAGAGAFPTASAVVGDILELAVPIAQGAALAPEPAPFTRALPLRAANELSCAFYVRLARAETEADASAAVRRAFEARGVAIARTVPLPKGAGIAVVTEATREDAMARALDGLIADGVALRVESVIRIEDVASWS